VSQLLLIFSLLCRFVSSDPSCFGVDTAKEQNAVILERPAPKETIKQSRIDLALERTKKYLLTQGHKVKIWPDEFEK
jgi:hypothetical protein